VKGKLGFEQTHLLLLLVSAEQHEVEEVVVPVEDVPEHVSKSEIPAPDDLFSERVSLLDVLLASVSSIHRESK